MLFCYQHWQRLGICSGRLKQGVELETFVLSEDSEEIVSTTEHASFSVLVFLLVSRTGIEDSLYSSLMRSLYSSFMRRFLPKRPEENNNNHKITYPWSYESHHNHPGLGRISHLEVGGNWGSSDTENEWEIQYVRLSTGTEKKKPEKATHREHIIQN